MAINVTTQDLENYPGITKTVTVDQASIIPLGEEGDEKYVLKFSTSAYSDIATTTAIQTLYITNFKTGWCKSSGFAGSGGKFNLDSTHNQLKVSIDSTVSGTDGSGYYTITLDYNVDETPISGEAVAADMEDKIRALTMQTADTGYALSYLNASVWFEDNKFYITSGSVGNYYTGTSKTSVNVLPATSNDCSNELGFNLVLTSEAMAATSTKEAALASNYTANTTPMTIAAGTGAVAGDCFMITDGNYTDYFTVLSGTTNTSLVVPTSGNNNYIGVTHDYATTSGTIVQRLRRQDPEGQPTMWYTDIDSIIRFGIKSIVNLIDFSS